MHMTIEDRLRLHLEGKDVTWRAEGGVTLALWTEDGTPRALLLAPQPLCASAVVDAYVLARPTGARVTLLHEGPLSPVAQRSAARFGLSLLDVEALPPAPGPVPAPVPEPAPAAAPAPVESPVPALPWELPAPLGLPAPAEPLAPLALPAPPAPALLPAPEVPPLLAAREDAPAPALPWELPGPTVAEVTLLVPEPAQVPPAPPAEPGPALPWDPSAPLAEPAVTVQVTPGELAALPWHAHAPLEEHVEVIQGSPRRPRRFVERPTVAGAPQAAGGSWGLPWTRPVPPTEGLSIADPRIWAAQERVHAVREEMDAAVGASSFGALKPEGSAWLKRIQTFGPP